MSPVQIITNIKISLIRLLLVSTDKVLVVMIAGQIFNLWLFNIKHIAIERVFLFLVALLFNIFANGSLSSAFFPGSAFSSLIFSDILLMSLALFCKYGLSNSSIVVCLPYFFFLADLLRHTIIFFAVRDLAAFTRFVKSSEF